MDSSSPPVRSPSPVVEPVIQQRNDDEEVVPTFRFAVSLDGVGCYDHSYSGESFKKNEWEDIPGLCRHFE